MKSIPPDLRHYADEPPEYADDEPELRMVRRAVIVAGVCVVGLALALKIGGVI